MTNGYPFTRDDFARLLVMARYPEQSPKQTEVFRAYFQAHLAEFDRVAFEVHVGTGIDPDPTHLPAVQQNGRFLTMQRVDLLAWAGARASIIECKERVTPSSLGQILTYRLLFMKELPDAPEPDLVVIGRYSDADTIDSLNAHGVSVYLYASADAGAAAVGGGV